MEHLSSATGCLETGLEALSSCTVTGEEALTCGVETDMEPLSCCIEPVLDSCSTNCCPMETGVEALCSCAEVGIDPLLCCLVTGCPLVDWSLGLALASLTGLALTLLSFRVETTLCPCAFLGTAHQLWTGVMLAEIRGELLPGPQTLTVVEGLARSESLPCSGLGVCSDMPSAEA